MASIKDIAKALGMSVSTVSLALNDKPRVSEETRALVKSKAKEMNYIKNGIAADLKNKKSNLILFVINDASRSFFSTIIRHLQEATANFDYDFLVCTTYGNHTATAERFIKEHRAAAVIIYTSTIKNEIIQESATANFPIVVLGRYVPGEYVFCYGYKKSGEDTLLTTEYLISRGLKRIAFVKGSSASLGTSRSFNHYINILKDHNIPFDETIVFDAKGSSYEHGYNITEKMLPILKNIDAIQYSTDDIAIGGLMCLKNNGIRVPEDISVVGRGNIPESKMIKPALTTSGANDENTLLFESIVHYLVLLIEKDEETKVVAEQLSKYLNAYSNPTQLYIRESVI